jgi:uncharacterized damage-inducible protein DinB
MTIEDLLNLLDFHYWARDRVLDALDELPSDQYTRDLGSSFRSIRDTAVHMYAAEWVWHLRWHGESPAALIKAETFPDVASLRQAWHEHEVKMRAFLEQMGEAGLNRVIEYRLFSGEAGASSFWQMVQHVVNHASYHRGQVTTMLRQIGAAPPKPTDLIAFYRSRSGDGLGSDPGDLRNSRASGRPRAAR